MVSLYSNSQEKKVNNYKYIIVSDKFDFLKETDQYQTSSLTKFLLKKNGFDVYLSSESLPLEIKADRCSALFVDVVSESSMFKTKLKIRLKDCFNKVVYISKIGESREKEYKKSYQDAIRDAYSNMSDIQYMPLSKNKEIKKEILKEKPQELTTNGAVAVIAKNKKPVVETANYNTKVLYAQPNKNGFQLINTKPEVIFLLFKTKVKDVYILKDKNGVLYKKGNIWVAEYYKNESLVTEEYQVKF